MLNIGERQKRIAKSQTVDNLSIKKEDAQLKISSFSENSKTSKAGLNRIPRTPGGPQVPSDQVPMPLIVHHNPNAAVAVGVAVEVDAAVDVEATRDEAPKCHVTCTSRMDTSSK